MKVECVGCTLAIYLYIYIYMYSYIYISYNRYLFISICINLIILNPTRDSISTCKLSTSADHDQCNYKWLLPPSPFSPRGTEVLTSVNEDCQTFFMARKEPQTFIAVINFRTLFCKCGQTLGRLSRDKTNCIFSEVLVVTIQIKQTFI